MANSDTSPIVSVPSITYDACSDAPVSGWVKLESGPADMQGHASGDWPDTGAWRQT